MTKFMKPDKHGQDYHQMSEVAIRRALRDAGFAFEKIEQAYVGYVNGDSCSGQRAVYTVGMTGIPIFNVNNYGCTGSATLYQASKAVSSGQADCVLALGFDKMFTGPLKFFWSDRSEPMERFMERDK
jgi:acetyl-CoA acetyltransferase